VESNFAPLNVSALLQKYGLRPSKGLGQNFLVDESALRKVVRAAGIQAGDVILEVGAGLGSLTRHLATAARRVIAVELDKKLLPALHDVLTPFENVEIVVGDILELDPGELLKSYKPQAASGGGTAPANSSPLTADRYKVVANIPYYITSALIRHLLEAEIRPQRMALTVQHEVAMRICAAPPHMSLLALGVQVYGAPSVEARIPAGAFYPPPKVDSAVVKIDLYDQSPIPENLIPALFRLAKAGFGQKRKTLRNALAAGLGCPKENAENLLAAAGIDPQRRAETLSLAEWGELAQGFQMEQVEETN
jgi:16S rRNA (adenine1518-N6/adenine1519-N6)-dimethyltransferase